VSTGVSEPIVSDRVAVGRRRDASSDEHYGRVQVIETSAYGRDDRDRERADSTS
jgi:hypothetical protein